MVSVTELASRSIEKFVGIRVPGSAVHCVNVLVFEARLRMTRRELHPEAVAGKMPQLWP
jgi:hypothetical protein